MAGVFKQRMTARTAFLSFLTPFFLVYADSVSSADVVQLTNSNLGDSNEVVVRCSDMERKALLTFREGLEDPSARLSSWVGQDCCAWEGVLCSKQTGAVVKLDLSNNVNRSLTLGGRLNPSLLQLKQLSYLNLSDNDFNKTTIPKFFGSLEKLVYLDLSSSSFSGMVPPHLGNLSNLHYLDLSALDCWISDLNWISRLSSLEYINLNSMNLSSANTHWLQAFNMLPSLSELHLQNCQLHSFPNSLPDLNFTSLSIIDLSLNNFNSLLPHYFFNLSRHLVDLDLGSCHLKGLLTQVVRGDCCNIEHLHLGNNEIRGEISELLGGLSRCNNSLEEFHLPDSQSHGQLPAGNYSLKRMGAKLRSLVLRDNIITGSLPESIGMLSNLRFLDLYNNTISGPIPPSIGKLLNLEVLELSLNNMSGIIPESSLQNLNKLTKLGLWKNGWEGTLSQNHFLGLTNLKDFQVSSSSLAFQFNLSDGWNPPFSLETLKISNCLLGPTFPSWLENQTQLTGLRLSKAGITSEVPHWFWKLSRLMEYIDLSGNQLRGTLPGSLDFLVGYNNIDLSSNRLEGSLPVWSNVFSLSLADNLFTGSIPLNMGHVMSETSYLDLSGNLITGRIPYSIGKMKCLWYLGLSNNSLSGHIPDKWTDLQDLYVLDLSSNNLSGSIPASIFSLSSLLWLRLSRNNLSGELSFPLQNSSCTSLITLDLGNNKFSGKIPESIGERFLSLSELRIRDNAFTGKIPQQLCRLSVLHVLDLSLNKLSGSIPPCLGNLSGLIAATVEHHMPLYRTLETVVKGTEYEYMFWGLVMLNLIDLSENSLSGKIPEEITKLIILGTLNVSHNRLTGTIPEKIGDLQHLETLDLSNNHLSGVIPRSMISLTFLSHLNLSQNNLSGTIPSEGQFSTFDASVFSGNLGLCGLSLTKCIVPCREDKECSRDHDKGKSNKDKGEIIGVYISVVAGFMVGFWSVCGSLVVKESWRHAFFRFISKSTDWIVVIVAVTINRIRRRDGN